MNIGCFEKIGSRVLLATALIFHSGCSASRQEKHTPIQIQRSGMTVSVQSGGRPIEEFEQNLIARVDLAAEDVVRIAEQNERPLYQFGPIRDNQGRIYGIRVAKILTRSNPLKLTVGDIVTAVGQTKTTVPHEFADIWTAQLHNSMVTTTIERSGKPHKLIYYLPD